MQIELPPDDTNAPCHYSLIQTAFDQAPPYETLSYVWGSDDRNGTVTLKNGKFLPITEPLKEALAFVERQCLTGTGYLWVDQICIDQDDRNERSQQVKLMGQIYTSCSRVLIWLGRMTRLDTELSSADDLEQRQSPKDTLMPKVSIMRHLVHGLRKVTRYGGSSTGNVWLEILHSEWFQRAWVFQEVVLPPSAQFILATMSTLPHQALTISLSELHTKSIDTEGADVVVDTIRMMYRRYNEQRKEKDHPHSPIEQTLSHLAPRAKTSEQLDRLYAFFGLNSNTFIDLTPSYDSSMEVAMIDTATSIIEGTCSLDLFEVIPRAVEYTIHNVGIPTWTPDFRDEHLVLPFKRSATDFRQLAKSFPELYPLFIPTQTTYYLGTKYCAGEEKRTIQAHGFVLDCVYIEIGSLSSRTTIETQLNALLKRCIKTRNKLKWFVEHKDSSVSRHKRKSTGLAKFTVDLGLAPEPNMERLCQVLTAEGCCEPSYEYPPPRPSQFTENIPSKHHIMMQVMRGRTLWMTQSGRFVLGSYLQTGDHICLAYGCSNPIALRGQHDRTRILGTCFLEGWMDPWSNGKIERARKEFPCTVFYIA